MVLFVPIPQVSSFNFLSRFGETQVTSGHFKRAAAFLVLWCGSGALAIGSKPALCFEKLSSMSWRELECLYRQAEPGHIPNGFAQGAPYIVPMRRSSASNPGQPNCFGRGNISARRSKRSSINGAVSAPFAPRFARERVGSTANHPSSWIIAAHRGFGRTFATRCVRYPPAFMWAPCIVVAVAIRISFCSSSCVFAQRNKRYSPNITTILC